MSTHLLVTRSFRFRPTAESTIKDWVYRRDIGAWVAKDANDRLMVSMMADPPRPPGPYPRPPEPPMPPMSKKADMETGEDMKGA